MSVTNLLNELRDLEFPVDQLQIEILNCKLSECPLEFTLSARESFDENTSIAATLYYQWKRALNEYCFSRYVASLSDLSNPENNRKQTFYLTKGHPRLTLREANNLLQGRFLNKTLIPVNGSTPYNAWLHLDFYDLDSRGDYKFIYYASRFPYDLEYALRFYPIRGLDHPPYTMQLIQRLKRGDQVRVTFVKPSRLQRVYIAANPCTKLINLNFKPSKTSPKDENEQQQAPSSQERG